MHGCGLTANPIGQVSNHFFSKWHAACGGATLRPPTAKEHKAKDKVHLLTPEELMPFITMINDGEVSVLCIIVGLNLAELVALFRIGTGAQLDPSHHKHYCSPEVGAHVQLSSTPALARVMQAHLYFLALPSKLLQFLVPR